MHQYTRLIASFCLGLLLSGCATTQISGPRRNDAIAQTLQEASSEKSMRPVLSSLNDSGKPKTATDIENMTIDEMIGIEEPNTQNLYDNSRYDFPITINSKVEGWIDYFTGRGRGHMERYLSRSSRYMPVMKQIFKKAGLPEDLVYLALIESGFNLRAKSHARAVGPWQFMKATGKRYGLRADAWVDERKDPLRSTEAAANYLKDLYLMFESWYLAASAYNAGEYKVLRAIEETKTNNYWRICQTKTLRRETKDYVPKLIAAAIIGKNPSKYGFHELSYEEPLQFDSVTIDASLKLKEIARIIDVPEDDILDLNPSFARGIVPATGGPYELRLPVGAKVLIERTLGSVTGKLDAADIPLQISVKAGETLRTLAQKHRINLKDLANANNLSPKEKLTPGAVLIIPHKTARGSQTKVATANRATSSIPKEKPKGFAPETSKEFMIHVVKSGESLWSISEKYDVTVQNIFRWNNLKRSQIMPGKKLRIRASKTGAQSGSAATHADSNERS